jgi:outer membrane protein
MKRGDMLWACLRFLNLDDSLRLRGGRIIILLFLSMLGWSCASVNEGVPSGLVIGVVDPQRILQETVKGQQLSDNLNAFMKDRQALVELEQKELRNLEDALRAQMTVLSQSARELKEEQFRQKMAAYQQKVADLNREVQEKQRELQNQFRSEVGEVVAQLASDRNLGLVLEQGPNSGTLFHEESWDISTEVIEALNQMSDESPVP